MRSTILIVEDDEALSELLAFHLSSANFEVCLAASAEAAWEQLANVQAVVLDWMLPDESGVDWLGRLRRSDYADLPVLMLTARASEVDKVTGLNAGADDYLVKPFSAAELVARINALLRRLQTPSEKRVGAVLVDDVKGSATLNAQPLQLTRREFELLHFLLDNPARVFSRGDLLDRVWGEDFIGTDRTVDQHVAQLRALIGSEYIQTVRGRGYRLVDPQDAS